MSGMIDNLWIIILLSNISDILIIHLVYGQSCVAIFRNRLLICWIRSRWASSINLHNQANSFDSILTPFFGVLPLFLTLSSRDLAQYPPQCLETLHSLQRPPFCLNNSIFQVSSTNSDGSHSHFPNMKHFSNAYMNFTNTSRDCAAKSKTVIQIMMQIEYRQCMCLLIAYLVTWILTIRDFRMISSYHGIIFQYWGCRQFFWYKINKTICS